MSDSSISDRGFLRVLRDGSVRVFGIPCCRAVPWSSQQGPPQGPRTTFSGAVCTGSIRTVAPADRRRALSACSASGCRHSPMVALLGSFPTPVVTLASPAAAADYPGARHTHMRLLATLTRSDRRTQRSRAGSGGRHEGRRPRPQDRAPPPGRERRARPAARQQLAR